MATKSMTSRSWPFLMEDLRERLSPDVSLHVLALRATFPTLNPDRHGIALARRLGAGPSAGGRSFLRVCLWLTPARGGGLGSIRRLSDRARPDGGAMDCISQGLRLVEHMDAC